MEYKLPSKLKMHGLVVAGEKIYKRIKSRYEPKYNGKVLAIEPQSGQVYLGKTPLEAMMLAKKKQPDKMFYIMRIGFDAVYSMGGITQENN
jgi:Tfp pilus assembly protein PilX